MSARTVMPNRRDAMTFDVFFQGKVFHISFGTFHPGMVSEVFISSEKTSNDVADAARDAAVALSIAAQYGTPIEVIRADVTRDENGAPCSVVGAVLDAIAEQLT